MPRAKKKSAVLDYREMKKTAVLLVVKEGKSIRDAALSVKMPKSTLQRYVKQYLAVKEEKRDSFKFEPRLNTKQVFNESQEAVLKEYVLQASQMHYGLTRKQLAILAYEFAVMNQIKVPDSWVKNQQAGKDWLKGFFKRHPDLSVRKPEATSLSRATSFNQHNVGALYDNLEKASLQLGDNIAAVNYHNLDETALTTVHVPPKVIALKGQKQVGQVTSAERGTLVTACCIVAANGNSTPPFLIFPRVKKNDSMINGAPPGKSMLLRCKI